MYSMQMENRYRRQGYIPRFGKWQGCGVLTKVESGACPWLPKAHSIPKKIIEIEHVLGYVRSILINTVLTNS